MISISYLKSFKLKDNVDDDLFNPNEVKMEVRNYFHFIRYAIQNASTHSRHVNMKPCYGYDLTPSSGYLLESNGDIIETSLPNIKPTLNDFHFNLLSA